MNLDTDGKCNRFIINNEGYAIERVIHGAHEPYNDIMPWNYQLLPQFFDETGSHPAKTYKIRTPQELHHLIVEDKEFQVPDKLRVIEIYTGKHDYGQVLDVVGPMGDRFNLGLDPMGGQPSKGPKMEGGEHHATG